MELEVNGSAFVHMHGQGVSACSRLQMLTCEDSYISAADPAETIHTVKDRHFKMPSSLSSLTALTRLNFFYHNSSPDFQLSLGWLAGLPALQSLWTTVNVHVVEFPQGVSTMNGLTRLKLVNRLPGGQVRFSFDWAG